MAEDIIFSRAVNFVLPNSIPTHFDRTEEYKIGDVLVYERKLRPLMPWRKHRLVFTGVNISNLLTEAIQIDNGVQEVFSQSSTTRTFGESAKVDAEIVYAIAHLGIHIAESENATMSIDFGKIERQFSNLTDLLSRQAADKKLRVLTDHSVIKDAMAHSKTLFVINNVYVAEKADVSLTFTSDSKDTGADSKQVQTPAPPPPATTTSTTDTTTTTQTTSVSSAPGATISGDFNLSMKMTGNSVVKRDMQTNVAYRVIRFKLGSHGSLLPQLRSSIRHIKVRVVDETDFGGPSNAVDARNQTEDKCDYTHDRFEVMAAREDEP